MALCRPIVAYDLTEARVSADGAAVYATPNDVRDFARCIDDLLDSPARRAEMGRVWRLRVENDLSWRRSEEQLLAGYERARILAHARR
jgi:glycosyltransferase involved in cell wall biosynthesis